MLLTSKNSALNIHIYSPIYAIGFIVSVFVAPLNTFMDTVWLEGILLALFIVPSLYYLRWFTAEKGSICCHSLYGTERISLEQYSVRLQRDLLCYLLYAFSSLFDYRIVRMTPYTIILGDRSGHSFMGGLILWREDLADWKGSLSRFLKQAVPTNPERKPVLISKTFYWLDLLPQIIVFLSPAMAVFSVLFWKTFPR